MERRAAWILGIVFGGLFLCLFSFLLLMYLALRGDGPSRFARGGDRVGVVEIVGPIGDSKKTLEQLRDFGEAKHIKALVVRIDSPGGGAAPSQEIYEAIRKLKEKKKVVASMGSVAASGGFYIASAADKVFANPGTLTGSIGVVFQHANVEGLLKWAGVEVQTLTAGKLKDSGSPFRTMKSEEREYFLSLLADVHQQFIAAVAQGRNLPVEEVQPYADGRVFTGRQAKEWKLVDEMGSLNDAIAEAGRLGGIRGEAKPEYPKEDNEFWQQMITEGADSLFEGAWRGVRSTLGGAGFQFHMTEGDAAVP